MSELLSREQEFTKINKELDKKTKAALENNSVKTLPLFIKKASRVSSYKPLPSSRSEPRKNSSFKSSPKTEEKHKSAAPPAPCLPVSNEKNVEPRNSIKSPLKFSTIPRTQPKRLTKEQALITANRNLDKRTKLAVEDLEAKILPKKQPHSTLTASPKRLSYAVSRIPPKEVIETYRNENFKFHHQSECSIVESYLSELEPICNPEEKQDVVVKSVTSKIHRTLPLERNEKVLKKNLSTDGLIKYLKSRIGIIETELEDVKIDLKQKIEELQKTFDSQKKLEAQRDQVVSKNNSLMEQINKMEEKMVNLEKKLKEREMEYTSVVREVDSMKREIRVMSQANTNLEKRLFKANEDIENSRNNLSSVKDEQRELQNAAHKEKEAHERQIKNLKKQRTDLLSAAKKQLFLINNLRQQIACLEQSKMVSFGEKEFNKVLEWNTQN